jgi:Immunity protein 7
MHEFHGWFVLSETPEEADIGGLDNALAVLRAHIDSLSWPTSSAQLESNNGQTTLTLEGLVNRIRQEAADVDELLQLVASRLPGSYGILYDRADELPDCRSFRVRVMAKGVVRQVEDPFLSPTVPTIEN